MISRFSTAQHAMMRADRQDDSNVDLRGFFGILHERWRLIATLTIVAVALAIVYLVLATRTYTGVTSLLIDTRTRPAVGDPSGQIDNSPDAILVESQVRLIASDAVLRRVVESEKLASDPEFAAGGPSLGRRVLQTFGVCQGALDGRWRCTGDAEPRLAHRGEAVGADLHRRYRGDLG